MEQQRKSNAITVLLVYAGVFALSGVLFILSFRMPVFLGHALFYRGLMLLATTTGLVCGMTEWVRRRSFPHSITRRDVLTVTVMCFCINLVLFTHIPVTAERSITVNLLAYMDSGERGYTSDELTNHLIDTYVKKDDAIGKRISEQIESGTIEKTQGGYSITARGRLLMRFYRLVAQVFGITRGNVMPQGVSQ